MIFHIITMLLIVLKVLGLFPYSWWIVAMPSLVAIGFGLAFAVGVLIVTWLAND